MEKKKIRENGKMKVLQINSFFSIGGPPRIVKGVYDTIIRNGDECLLASSRGEPISGMNIYRIGNSMTTYACALSSRFLDNDGFAAIKATRRLVEKIKEYDPDIIQIHNLHGYYINIEILFEYLKTCGKPIVWTFHDCWPMTGHCPHFTMAKCEKYKKGCYHCPLKKEYPSSYFIDNSKRNWERKKAAFTGAGNMTIVCVSQWLEAMVKESFLSQYNTQVIYNGVNLEPFKRVKSDFREVYGVEGKKLLLGVALHWVARKGLYDYIDLAKILDDSYRIVMVGLSEGEVKNLPKNIIPVPPIFNDHMLAKIYSACDLYINLSYEETFGMTSVEALACQTPIITYDLTAVPEVARIFNAPVVQAGNIEALKKTIEHHFENPRKEQYNVLMFEQKAQYQKYYDLYTELI